jgi:hypothetical protein
MGGFHLIPSFILYHHVYTHFSGKGIVKFVVEPKKGKTERRFIRIDPMRNPIYSYYLDLVFFLPEGSSNAIRPGGKCSGHRHCVLDAITRSSGSCARTGQSGGDSSLQQGEKNAQPNIVFRLGLYIIGLCVRIIF